MKPKHAELKATIVVLIIAGYCTWIELSSKEMVGNIIVGTIIVAVAYVVWLVVFKAIKDDNPYSNY